jgi:hypothetical protein
MHHNEYMRLQHERLNIYQQLSELEIGVKMLEDELIRHCVVCMPLSRRRGRGGRNLFLY